MFANVAFQPHTGILVVLADGAVNVVTSLQTPQSVRRGNDMWICLPDGADDDVQSDGCVRFASLRDTRSWIAVEAFKCLNHLRTLWCTNTVHFARTLDKPGHNGRVTALINRVFHSFC